MKAQWKDAIEEFKYLLKKYPATRFEDARFWVGHSYIELKKYQEGIKWLMQFYKMYPNNSYAPQALFEVGQAYERLGKYDKAISTYNKVASLYPSNAVSLSATHNEASIYAQRKFEYNKAIMTLKKAKSLAKIQGMSPDSPYISMAEKRIKFIEENSDYQYKPLQLFSKGLNYEERGNWQKALYTYQYVLKKYPDSKISDDAFYRVIQCYLRLNKWEIAREKAKYFLNKYPSSPYINKVKRLYKKLDKKEGDLHISTIFFV